MNKDLKEFIESHIEEIEKEKWDDIMHNACEKAIYDEFLTCLRQAGVQTPAEFTAIHKWLHIDSTNTPPYLNDAFFTYWFNKFNKLLVKIGLSEWNCSNVDLKVEFSNEEKKKLYGTLTIEELKEIIRDSWGVHKEIEEILDKIDSYDDYHKLLQELMGAIYRIYPERDCRNPEELHALLDDLEFEMPILGEYINNHKLIILYIPNIEKAAVDHGNISSREFEKIFIHELFHAYHYADDSDELVERYDYTSKVVKESLASAFEWHYCIENKINGDDKLKDSWYKYSVLIYPYSGARNLILEIGRFTGQYTLDNKKFFKIFDLSLTDMDGALRVLLPYEFYRIKNLIHIHEKKVVITAKAHGTYADFCMAMKGKKVGQIARDEIPPIISRKPFLTNDLLDEDYCGKIFCIPASVLSNTQVFLPCGDRKYYAKPKVNANGNTYYLYMHWREENHRRALLDWIWANK